MKPECSTIKLKTFCILSVTSSFIAKEKNQSEHSVCMPIPQFLPGVKIMIVLLGLRNFNVIMLRMKK